MNIVEPIRDKRDILAMKKYLREKDEKYYIMFLTGINLGLRINEILDMRVGDVKNRTRQKFRQSKTGKEITVAYNADLIRAYKEYCKDRTPDEALIPSNGNEFRAISRQQAYKVLREAAEYFGIENIGTHSLRKTCGYHYYNETKDIATLQIWFNHRDNRDTLRYIGITQDNICNEMIKFSL